MDDFYVRHYLKQLIESNAVEDLDFWLNILSMAEIESDNESAEQLYKIALDFAERHMSAEAIVNTLLCLSAVYRDCGRMTEAETALARAARLFEDGDAA